MRLRSTPRRSRFVGFLCVVTVCVWSPGIVAAAGILYLERCVSGCVYQAGLDNSCNNRSSIISGTRLLSEFSGSNADWDLLAACVADVLEPYDVFVTDVDPGCSQPFWEIAVAGTPTELGVATNTAGVAPFACAVLPNAPAFAFANTEFDMLRLCWTVVHEFNHLLGADHEILKRDPMTYIPGCLVKRFSEQFVDCGEDQDLARNCCTGSPTQSSASILRAALGSRVAGPIFPDGFSEWNVDEQTETGSTCHWDFVVGEVPPTDARASDIRPLSCATRVAVAP